MAKSRRVLVAMSGGVDSSVAAYLLQQQGYECIGATMRLFDEGLAGRDPACACDNAAEIEDACAVARRLGIPFHVIDFRAAFERDVVDAFVDAYEQGLTPNPCAVCNRRIKFGALLAEARRLGCEYLATGHYARVERMGGDAGAPARDGAGAAPTYALRCALDASKDQSYFLYSLTQDALARVLFPLGALTKEGDVRRIAREQGFENARKRDSQGICFVPDNDFARFIELRHGEALPEGDILDTAGTVLGRHRGALRYTVGQRKGLGVAAAHPLYVTRVDVAANTVTLGEDADLMASALIADDWIWSAPQGEGEALLDRGDDAEPDDDAASGRAGAEPAYPLSARIRYHQRAQAARIRRARAGELPPDTRGEVLRIDFAEPQRAIAPGQTVVLYEGARVLGGGRIRRAL